MRLWPRSVEFDDEPVAVLLPEPLASEVRALLADDDYVEAIRRVRQRTHLGILPAAWAGNAVRDSPCWPTTSPAPGGTPCRNRVVPRTWRA